MAICSSSFGLGSYGSPPAADMADLNEVYSMAISGLQRYGTGGLARSGYTSRTYTTTTSENYNEAVNLVWDEDITPKNSNCKNCAGPLNWFKQSCEYCGTFFH